MTHDATQGRVDESGAWWPDVPQDNALPKRPLPAGDSARVVWRHDECRRQVLVVSEVEGQVSVTTYFRTRVALDSETECAEINGHVVAEIPATAPVNVRCCSAPFSVSWAEAWRDLKEAQHSRRVVTRTIASS